MRAISAFAASRWAVIVAALICSRAFADSDTLLQAVGFALTGSDNAKVQPIDRANCVFRVDSDNSGLAVFHLNNVQLDRVVIQN
jgi:hypothetical protein